MRGIPFDVSVAEIERFFTPLPCYEIKVRIVFLSSTKKEFRLDTIARIDLPETP